MITEGFADPNGLFSGSNVLTGGGPGSAETTVPAILGLRTLEIAVPGQVGQAFPSPPVGGTVPGFDVTFSQQAVALVPEPSTFALLALGGGALAGWRRCGKKEWF